MQIKIFAKYLIISTQDPLLVFIPVRKEVYLNQTVALKFAIPRSPQVCVLPLPVIHTNSLADTQVLAFNLFSKRFRELIYTLELSRTLLENSKIWWRRTKNQILGHTTLGLCDFLSLFHTTRLNP